jgi:site-specific DNA-cytosine methylase
MVAVGSLCARTGQSISVQDAAQGHLMPTWPAEISSTLDTTFGTKMGLENQHVNAGCPMFVPAYGIPGNWIGRKPENGGNATEPMYDIAPCLTKADQHGVAQPTIVHGTQDPCVSDIAFAQGRNNGGENVMVQAMAVRRLTPVECERLQGFGDNYTDIQAKGKPTPDGPRYKALGNSMAVPVMAWIGQRIQEVEAICKQNK